VHLLRVWIHSGLEAEALVNIKETFQKQSMGTISMPQKRRAHYRNQLLALRARVRADAQAVEEKALGATGGQLDGGLSNIPMHLADLGTDTFMHDLNETLLENEQHLIAEITAAIRRIEDGTFGLCESCGTPIPETRISAMPYTRFCVSCAEDVSPDPARNLRFPAPRLRTPPQPDSHASGTAGGGTAVGGLAGTNQGHGDPEPGSIETATANSEFDREDQDQGEPLAGSAGGATGGTPAGKRSGGGKPRRVKGLQTQKVPPKSDRKKQRSPPKQEQS
jgi:RNA polymerase-binding transcription factor DksA